MKTVLISDLANKIIFLKFNVHNFDIKIMATMCTPTLISLAICVQNQQFEITSYQLQTIAQARHGQAPTKVNYLPIT